MSVRLYLLGVVLLMGALVAVEATRPRPLDLTIRLEREGAAPFDAEVFYASLPAWLGQPVEPVAVPPFERLADSSETGRTYVFLTQTFEPDPVEAARLLDFVARGNTVFVATQEIYGAFADSLGRTFDVGDPVALQMMTTVDSFLPFGEGLGADTLRLHAPGVAGDYAFPIGLQRREVFGFDERRTERLGSDAADEEPTLVRIAWGGGHVLVSSTPLAFTNAALTGDGEGPAYVGAVLAALPDQPVWWDDTAKPHATQARTPLRVVLTTPALRWAYLLLVAAGVLFAAFRGRRWQRPVPVIAPPPNAQRAFAETVGRLHFAHRDDARLGRRVAEGVRDRLRSELRIPEPAWDDATARLAAARAGVPEDEALALFRTLARVARRPTPDDLIRLDARIAAFFRHTGAPGLADAPSGSA